MHPFQGQYNSISPPPSLAPWHFSQPAQLLLKSYTYPCWSFLLPVHTCHGCTHYCRHWQKAPHALQPGWLHIPLEALSVQLYQFPWLEKHQDTEDIAFCSVDIMIGTLSLEVMLIPLNALLLYLGASVLLGQPFAHAQVHRCSWPCPGLANCSHDTLTDLNPNRLRTTWRKYFECTQSKNGQLAQNRRTCEAFACFSS